MTTADVKRVLRRRYSASQQMGGRMIPGGWTCIDEFMGIDVLAVSAHSQPKPNIRGVRYPRVGHEVKVSRSDYRRELLDPGKRKLQVEWCNAFFFVTPAGLLTDDEKAFVEPEWAAGDWKRVPCENTHCRMGKMYEPFIGPLERRYWYRHDVQWKCETCGGRGYMEKSRVELEAPTLWVPRDVGLIEAYETQTRVVRQAPVRKEVPGISAGRDFGVFVRWISVRPDPRHTTTAEETL